MTTESTFLPLLLVAAQGMLLGTAFYGGLWWTVRRGVASPRPALWFFGSGLVRTGVALACVWWIGDGQWDRLSLCLVGLTVARLLVARVIGSATRTAHRPATGHF